MLRPFFWLMPIGGSPTGERRFSPNHGVDPGERQSLCPASFHELSQIRDIHDHQTHPSRKISFGVSQRTVAVAVCVCWSLSRFSRNPSGTTFYGTPVDFMSTAAGVLIPGGLLSGFFAYRFAPETPGTGMESERKSSIQHHGSVLPKDNNGAYLNSWLTDRNYSDFPKSICLDNLGRNH